MTQPFQLRLGLSMRYPGYHAAARYPDVRAAGALDIDCFPNTASIAEQALFDMVFLIDGFGARARRACRIAAPVGAEYRAGAEDLAVRLGAHDAPCQPRRHGVHHLQRADPHSPQIRLVGSHQSGTGALLSTRRPSSHPNAAPVCRVVRSEPLRSRRSTGSTSTAGATIGTRAGSAGSSATSFDLLPAPLLRAGVPSRRRSCAEEIHS